MLNPKEGIAPTVTFTEVSLDALHKFYFLAVHCRDIPNSGPKNGPKLGISRQ